MKFLFASTTLKATEVYSNFYLKLPFRWLPCAVFIFA